MHAHSLALGKYEPQQFSNMHRSCLVDAGKPPSFSFSTPRLLPTSARALPNSCTASPSNVTLYSSVCYCALHTEMRKYWYKRNNDTKATRFWTVSKPRFLSPSLLFLWLHPFTHSLAAPTSKLTRSSFLLSFHRVLHSVDGAAWVRERHSVNSDSGTMCKVKG